MNNIKSNTAIKKISLASQIVHDTLCYIERYVEVGRSTEELNQICHDFILRSGGRPACLNYKGFPKSICTSVNDVVCHGIPSPTDILKRGDIINIDLVVEKGGYMGDASKTFILPGCAQENIELVDKARYLRDSIIEMLKPGVTLYDIAAFSTAYIKKEGLFSTDEFCGHGIGRNMHEDPYVYFCTPHSSSLCKQLKSHVLKVNEVLTVEPVLNISTNQVITEDDGWTVRTTDGGYSAQWEHTIAIVPNGCKVLT